MKFRKKPVVIDAYKFDDDFYENPDIPKKFKDACCRNNDVPIGHTIVRPHIHTLKGVCWVVVGDWIIQGVKGEFYPCKPDIFELTYEKVE